MNSILPLSALALVAACVLAGCGQNPEGNLAGSSSTNSNATMGGASNLVNMDTNLPASTNMPTSTNMPMSTNN